MDKTITQRLVERGLLRYFLPAFMALVFAQAIAHFGGFIAVPDKNLVDFDAFHIAGQMVLAGDAADAYSADLMLAAQERFSGSRSFMPWSYPPQFDLVVAGLALMPLGLAFTLFVALSCAAYLWVLRQLAGSYVFAVLLAIVPALQINLKTGQNGFVTGALIGAFCLLSLKGRGVAGVPLGLMVIKPHLALGLGLSVLVARRWRIVAVAAAVVAATSLLATLALGAAIWPAFLGGAEQATGFLKQGFYPLFRMTSLFAALRSAGVPGELALTLQAGLALTVFAAVVYATLKLKDQRLVLAAAILGSLTVSPYNYDYDLPLLGIALALLAPRLFERARDLDFLLILIFTWIACGAGTATVAIVGPIQLVTDLSKLDLPPSFGFYGYLALLATLAVALRRAPRTAGAQAQAAPDLPYPAAS